MRKSSDGHPVQEKQFGNLLSASAYHTRSRIDGRGFQDTSLKEQIQKAHYADVYLEVQ